MSGIANSSRAFDALTLPPYRIRTDPPIVASSAATLAADQRVHVLRLLRRRGAARADGPDRLVGDDGLSRRPRHAAHGQHGVELPGDHLRRAPALALLERLADAQHGHEPLRLRRDELARNQRVGLAVERAALGMADEHVAATDVLQHRCGDFAGEGALRLRAQRPARRARRRESFSRRPTSCRYTNGGQSMTSAVASARAWSEQRPAPAARSRHASRASSSCRRPGADASGTPPRLDRPSGLTGGRPRKARDLSGGSPGKQFARRPQTAWRTTSASSCAWRLHHRLVLAPRP